ELLGIGALRVLEAGAERERDFPRAAAQAHRPLAFLQRSFPSTRGLAYGHRATPFTSGRSAWAPRLGGGARIMSAEVGRRSYWVANAVPAAAARERGRSRD